MASIGPSAAGTSRTRIAPRAESLDDETEGKEVLRAAEHARGIGVGKLDHFRHQKRLAHDAARLHRALHPFVDDAFVRGVLIDEHQSVRRLGHDIGVVNLAAREAERRRGACWCAVGAGGERVDHGARIVAHAFAQLRHTGAWADAGASVSAMAACAAAVGRAESGDGGLGDGGGGAVTGLVQRRAERADDQPRTRLASRKRTSAFAGCTFTSTKAGSHSRNRASAG